MYDSGGAPDEVSRCVAVFHDAIASGRVDEAAEAFAFDAALEYWRNITTALGVRCEGGGAFRQTVMEILRRQEVREKVSSCRLADFKCKVIGGVGSVVFKQETVDGESLTGVATVAVEAGRWKVRTYPGVFPGTLLAEAKQSAARARDGGPRKP
jgi:hypothetical protein